jgi:hypothetical protein
MAYFNKFRGTKGFVSLWERVIRFRYMITETAKQRAKILAFWEQYGDQAVQDAFGISRPTLYRWQRAIREGAGKLEALNKQSTAPKRRRKRVIPDKVKDLILAERSNERIGKEKLAVLLEEDGIATLSASTVGRMLGDMKKQGLLSDPVRYSLFGKTGNLIEKKPKKTHGSLKFYCASENWKPLYIVVTLSNQA